MLWLSAAVAAADFQAPPASAGRPDPAGTPTEVAVAIFLVDLQGIEDTKQTFGADFFVTATWRDPRLTAGADGTPLAGCRLPLAAVWHPKLAIINDRDLKKRLEEQVTIEADGVVRYAQRFLGELRTPLDLRDFPFDRHQLAIEAATFGYPPEEVSLVVDPGTTGRLETLSAAEWSIGAAAAAVEPLRVEQIDRTISRVVYRLEVSRETGFYLWKVFMPLTLIVFMSWAVFWIDPSHVPPQIGVATSAVLTLIAFQFSLGYLLPRVSYLTRADRFLLGSVILVFTAFGEAIVTSWLAGKERQEMSRRIDRQARWLFPLAFGAVVAVAFRF